MVFCSQNIHRREIMDNLFYCSVCGAPHTYEFEKKRCEMKETLTPYHREQMVLYNDEFVARVDGYSLSQYSHEYMYVIELIDGNAPDMVVPNPVHHHELQEMRAPSAA
ncbi:hypothetical protein OAD26_00580 [bacterium]|nr:hypothetical protein [bacterium]